MKKKDHLVLLLFWTIGLLLGKAAPRPYVSVVADPNTIQDQNAAFIMNFVLGKSVPVGGTLRLSFPEAMSVSSDVANCRDIDDLLTITSCVADPVKNFIEITLGSEILLPDGVESLAYQIQADSALNLPMTNAVVEPVSLLTSAGELQTTSFKATQGELKDVRLIPADQTVGSDTSLSVSIMLAHKIPKKGKLHIGVSAAWNEGSPESRIEYFSSITCSAFIVGGTVVPDGSYSCSFLDGNRVEIDGGFENQEGEPNTLVSIYISGFRNPILANEPMDVFSVYSTDENELNIIDYLDTSIMVTDPAQLTHPSIGVAQTQVENIGIVQEINEMTMKFTSPVPFHPNCQVEYWFPTADYDASDITSIRTGSLFTSSAQTFHPEDSGELKTFSIIEESPIYKAVKFTSCEIFRPQKTESTTIYGLRQPKSTRSSRSIKIYIRDEDGHIIAQRESGLSFTAQPGTLEIVSSSVDPTTVSSEAMFSWTIKLQHSLVTDAGTQLSIKFPSDYEIKEECSIEGNDALGSSRTCTGDKISNTLMIADFTNGDYIGGELLSFTLGPVVLPLTVSGGKGAFEITSFLQHSESEAGYSVDTGSFSNLFTMTVGTISSATVTPSSLNAFAKAEYTFTVVPEHRIPQYGLLMVQYPEQVQIEDPSLSQTLCSGWENFPSTTPVCTVFTANRTIIVSKGFQAGEGGEGGTTSYTWKVPFVTNPPTLNPTDTFIFQTRDQYFSRINELTSGVSITMEQAAPFHEVTLALDSDVNSITTKYTFTVVATVPVNSGNAIKIVLPPECTKPEEAIQCRPEGTSPLASVACSQVEGEPQAIIAELKLQRTIPPLETFQFSIDNIRNPRSTKPSGDLAVKLLAAPGSENILNEISTGLRVITSIPFFVDSDRASISQSVKGAGLDSVYTLSFGLSHDIGANGGLLIRYPPQVLVDADAGVVVDVDLADFGISTLLEASTIDFSAKQILVDLSQVSPDTALPIDSNQLQQVRITIAGMRNPLDNRPSESFEIVTFNKEGNSLYLIDQLLEGLPIKSKCNYPCEECSSGNPSQCTKCYTDDKPFLQDGTCLERCSDGRYYERLTGQCLTCDPTCLTCDQYSYNCTSCGVGDNLLLREFECVTSCGPGFIEDPSNNMCHFCDRRCKTCEVSTNNCTDCQFGSTYPFLFDFNCHPQCPPPKSVLVGDKCQSCDPKCKTCTEEPGHCTSCESHMLYDVINNDCLEMCIPHEQVFNPRDALCESCHENCLTCAGDVNTCTSCKEGFVLNMDSRCEPECSRQDQTPVDGVCRECEKPCGTCDGDVSKCKTCLNDFLLFKTTCVDHCPDRYEANNETVNQCKLVGLICPDGFHLNDDGEGCVPNEFECKEGFEINEKQTACIPSPGTPILFPFFVMTLCSALVVAGSYLKDKRTTKVNTIFVLLVGSMELIEYTLIAYFAWTLEKYLEAILACVAVLMLIYSNVSFTVSFRRQALYSDPSFNEWAKVHPKTSRLVQLLCFFVNMKFVRYFFSGFYGLENALAPFSAPEQTVHQNLVRMTYFQFIFVYLPIFFADVSLIFGTQWGHQLLVLAIETLILQSIVIYMSLGEIKNPEALYSEKTFEGAYHTLKPRKANQNAVMGVMEEDMDEDNLIRFEKDNGEYEVYLRKKALTSILQQVELNFQKSKTKGVDIGGEITKVYSKFDRKQIQLRRAFSTEDLTELQRQKQNISSDGTKIEEGYYDEEDEDDIESCFPSEDSQYEVLMHRRYSFPFPKQMPVDVIADETFAQEIEKMRIALIDDKYFDNCYAVPKKISLKSKKGHVRKKKMVNRRTQTYLRELLQVEGEPRQDSDMEIMLEEDPEIQENYTQGLIDGVIECISESTSKTKEQSKENLRTNTQEVIAKEPVPSRRTKGKGTPLQDFRIEDIVGEFEIDELGNFMILRGETGEMLDKRGRLVNQRGYLVDKMGNILNQNEEIIFKFQDVSANGEIPAAYAFEKRKQNLFSMAQNDQFAVKDFGNGPGKMITKLEELESENDEDIVEKQFNRLKQGERLTSRSSGSEDGEMDLIEKERLVGDGQNLDQDVVDIITKKTVPMKKEDHISTKIEPKRPNSGQISGGLYLGGQFKDQSKQSSKLKKITDSISGIKPNSFIDEKRVIPEERASIDKKRGPMSETSSVKKSVVSGAVNANFFMPTQANPDANQSLLSQDIVTLNEGLQKRPGMKPPRKGGRGDFRQGGQTSKVYSNIADVAGFEVKRKRNEFSPNQSATRGFSGIRRQRPESTGNRSADPRMKGLESIYLNKFKGLSSQKNVNLKKPFQQHSGAGLPPPPRQTFLQSMGNNDMIHASELNHANTQKQALVAETIDRLQQEYLAQGMPISQVALAQSPMAGGQPVLRHQFTEQVPPNAGFFHGPGPQSQQELIMTNSGSEPMHHQQYNPPMRYEEPTEEMEGEIEFVEEEQPAQQEDWYNEERVDPTEGD